MKNKVVSLLLFFVVLSALCHAQVNQSFRIICDTAHFPFAAPFVRLEMNSISEVVEDWGSVNPQNKTAPFEFNLHVPSVELISLVNSYLIAIPGQQVKVLLDYHDGQERLIIADSNNINFLLQDFEVKARAIIGNYNDQTSYNDYLKLYDSLSTYVKHMIAFVNTPSASRKYAIGRIPIIAFTQYCTATLASFLMFPAYGHPMFTGYREQIPAFIKKNIKIDNARFFLQVQVGKGFLYTYFNQFVLPQQHFQLEKALAADPLFRSREIQKFLGYRYFTSLAAGEIADSMPAVLKRINDFEKSYQFTKKEQVLFEHLKQRVQAATADVNQLFLNQALVNYKQQILTTAEKELLIRKKKVMLYYWASWCIPCLQTMNKLTTDKIMFKGEEYQLIFISIDKKQDIWGNVKKTCLTNRNSFRLTDFENRSLYKAFDVVSVPRIMIIDNGKVVNQSFSLAELAGSF